jgi:hypothetical protein
MEATQTTVTISGRGAVDVPKQNVHQAPPQLLMDAQKLLKS